MCVCIYKYIYIYIYTGCLKKTIHCLIYCNVKSLKAISLKYRAFHSERNNLDFDI